MLRNGLRDAPPAHSAYSQQVTGALRRILAGRTPHASTFATLDHPPPRHPRRSRVASRLTPSVYHRLDQHAERSRLDSVHATRIMVQHSCYVLPRIRTRADSVTRASCTFNDLPGWNRLLQNQISFKGT